ncbi:MAG: UvrD-helicase domain-containing protein [Bacteroides sp.]|nr:UvrD-helicase domain-containing protein [Roseburia sp.]MCM1345544.1 UvrD-helicase domain-containing protein [Bacteroides sp.]MCM1420375.1 UvrD-helicase domain-containing protein [Bacteroides sp.]
MHIPPINRLDPQQQAFLDKVSAFVNNYSTSFRNQWIQGFAGSGKSVLLAYAAKTILAKNPDSSILVVVFTKSLVEMFKADFKELGLDSKVTIDTYYGFMKGSSNYDYILCDEVQDLIPRVICEMNARGSNIIVAGDSNQSIYDSDPRWREATVTPSQIGRLINGEPYELGIIHRLSRSIIDAVQRFLPRMNIFSSKRDMTKDDTQIRLCTAPSEAKEVKYIMEQATKAVNVGDSTAVLIPTAQKIIKFVNQALSDAGKPEWVETTNNWGRIDFGAMNSHLRRNGIKMQYIGNGYGSFDENDHRIIIMTFHSAKSLDFENVFIPYANASMYISPNDSLAKTLFMVAMTRTRKNLYITYNGCPSDYLDAFKSNCSQIDISSTIQTPSFGGNSTWGF